MSNKVSFGGYCFVPLVCGATREAVRIYDEGHLRAVLQKNGLIAVHGSGAFTARLNRGGLSPHTKLNLAKVLRGLKLPLGEHLYEKAEAEYADYKRKLKIDELRHEAERLGYKLVKKRHG